MFDLRGKSVLVTGASYGLGEAFALAFAEAGADLILTARSADLLQSVADACRAHGVSVTAEPGDVTIEDDVRRVVATGVAERGRIDVLVNNAGVADLRGLATEVYDTETFRRIVEVDLVGAFVVAREVGHHMLSRGRGSIINVCSMMASGASELNIASYAAAKGGLLNLTRQLGVEWADRGVRVNAVSPGFIVTEMTRAPLEGMGMTTYIASRTPMRRVGVVHEVVGPVLFLASDASSYITGVDLLVDGGTNAANGFAQVMPVHYEWNADTAPRVPGWYEGFTPQPAWMQAWRAGIPGIHYPVPED